MDEIASIDIDDLRALIETLQGGNVSEFQHGTLVLKFHSPAGEVVLPAKGTVDSPEPKAPTGYVELLGKLPAWPKAE